MLEAGGRLLCGHVFRGHFLSNGSFLKEFAESFAPSQVLVRAFSETRCPFLIRCGTVAQGSKP